MQIRRLEDSLGVELLVRSARKAVPTAASERKLSYARRVLAQNVEVYSLLTPAGHEGGLTHCVRHDIVYPATPQVLRHFAADFPKVKESLLSSYTRSFKRQFWRGECDGVVTTADSFEVGVRL